MELKYEQLLEQKGLSISDLSEATQVAVDRIKKTKRAIDMIERSGRSANKATYDKIKFNDNLICEEIEGKNKKEESPKVEVSEVGLKIDKELKEVLGNSSSVNVPYEEFKSKCGTCLGIIWDRYIDGEENGVRTSYYEALLVETDENKTIKVKKI